MPGSPDPPHRRSILMLHSGNPLGNVVLLIDASTFSRTYKTNGFLMVFESDDLSLLEDDDVKDDNDDDGFQSEL